MKQTYSKPDFICIGLQKAGTTWLFRNLSIHPEVYLTPVKEVKFSWGYGKKYQADKNVLGNTFSRIFGNIGFEWRKRYLFRRIRAHKDGSHKLSKKEIIWDIKYLFTPQSIKWYTSLFDLQKISGDLDPQYARFTPVEIEKIKTHLPNVKIILILRNPIHRIWSSLKMRYRMFEKKSLEETTQNTILSTIDILLGKYPDYSEIIKIWTDVFSDNNIRLFYFDELIEHPMEYYQKVCEFIGIDYRKIGQKNMDQLKNKIFEGQKKEIPNYAKQYIAEHSIPMLMELQQNYPSKYVEKWIIEYTKILKSENQVISPI